MALAADTANIVRVLLHDGWHDVEPGSFVVGPYWYTTYSAPAGAPDRVATAWTQEVAGFSFMDRTSGLVISGEVTALRAVGRTS